MANCFTFTKGKSIVVEDTWTNQVVTQSSLSFSNAEDSLNETYETAVDENETQYLSVLESAGDETLEDIHDITLGSQKLLIQDSIGLNVETTSQNDFNVPESDAQQVVIFNVEGSNELYGIQVAQDNDGNVHRYQFQLRKTGDGQLEPMPETVQLLANEEDLPETQEEEAAELTHNDINKEQFEHPVYLQAKIEQADGSSQSHLFISEEPDVKKGVTKLFTEELEENYEETDINIKSEINLATFKQEFNEDENEECQDKPLEHDEESANFDENFTSEATSYDTAEILANDEDAVTEFDHQTIQEHYQEGTESHDAPLHFEQMFIHDRQTDEIHHYNDDFHEGSEDNSNILIIEKNPEPSESENEDYELVSQLPVTAEDVEDEEVGDEETGVWYSEAEIPVESIEPVKLTETSLLKTTNILKQPTNINKTVDPKKKAILYYMVPNTDQKENVNSLSYANSNPRSLLKNNLDLTKINEDNIKKLQREKLIERRYARSKEAIQAKMFNNFINKTTIPHAPVRQGRLPRKQLIKPVDNRRNEEIIVQEVMVSSKGFVESVSDRLKNLEVTSIVELSDSDEDNDLSNGNKKKEKHKKTKSGSAATTSDSEASVIEIIHTDDEHENTSCVINTVKKGPGRPKKNPEDITKRTHELDANRGSGSGSSIESTPSKKSRTDDSEVESDTNKPEINCPLCSKSFLNQNSLTTHIQHHNLVNSVQSTTKPVLQYRHKCDKCLQTFKNSILLKKHVCNISKELKNVHKCGICSKTFKDITVFNIHKKSHIKTNLVKTTTAVSISPRKFTPRPSTSSSKSLFKDPISFKCKECSKVCSSQDILTVHEKSHKKFLCSNCNMNFTSKILLDTHVRLKCVKNSPKDRRLSFKIRKSFISSPRIGSIRGRSINPHKPLASAANRTSNIPSSSARKSVLPNSSARKSAIPSSSPRKSVVPSSSARKSVVPSYSARKSTVSTEHSTRKSFAPRSASATANLGVSNSIRTKKILNPLFKDSDNATKKANGGLNTSNFVKNLEVEIQCDSCTMKFTNWTALFKHKVKNHGLHTPDKRVLEPKRRGIHKPLTLHGGIPANEKLNKVFQGIRRTFAMVNIEPADVPDGDTPEQKEENALPQVVISEPSQTEQ